MEKVESKLNLYQKILKITTEVGMIEKTGKNQQQGYGFIEHAEVVASIRPQLEKYGVIIMPETVGRTIERCEVTRSNGKQGIDIHVTVISRYTVINADNPDERFVCEWDGGEAIDSSDKATNKATTASHKTYLMKLFNMSDKEDADNDSPVASAVVSKGSSTSYPMNLNTVKTLSDLDALWATLSATQKASHKEEFTAKKVQLLKDGAM